MCTVKKIILLLVIEPNLPVCFNLTSENEKAFIGSVRLANEEKMPVTANSTALITSSLKSLN